jgi:hypothetical protein
VTTQKNPETQDLQTIFPTRSTAQTPAEVAGTCYLKVGLYRRVPPKSEKYVVYHDEISRYAKPDDGVKW